jgi:hypothetical protein
MPLRFYINQVIVMYTISIPNEVQRLTRILNTKSWNETTPTDLFEEPGTVLAPRDIYFIDPPTYVECDISNEEGRKASWCRKHALKKVKMRKANKVARKQRKQRK